VHEWKGGAKVKNAGLEKMAYFRRRIGSNDFQETKSFYKVIVRSICA